MKARIRTGFTSLHLQTLIQVSAFEDALIGFKLKWIGAEAGREMAPNVYLKIWSSESRDI